MDNNNPHSRVYIAPDDHALKMLKSTEYKVLRYLVNRADPRGVCYPTINTIHQAIGGRGDDRQTHRALETLWQMDYVRFVRRDTFDPATGRKMPNVYIVNPSYICLSAERKFDAREMWNRAEPSVVEVTRGNAPSDLDDTMIRAEPSVVEVTITNNRTNTNNQHQLTKHQNQQQQPAPESAKSPKNKAQALENGSHNETVGHEDTYLTAEMELQEGVDQNERQKQRKAQKQQSATKEQNPPLSAAPPPTRRRYVNPAAINEPLTGDNESLAEKLKTLGGISLPLGRALIVEYGAGLCEQAYNQVRAAMAGGDIKRPGGLFRSILQKGFTDAMPANPESVKFTGGKYAAIIES